jgi:hypothetical protein
MSDNGHSISIAGTIWAILGFITSLVEVFITLLKAMSKSLETYKQDQE